MECCLVGCKNVATAYSSYCAEHKPSAASVGYAPDGSVIIDDCAQCGADPAIHCTAGRAKGREPHDLDGAWIKCGACGNTITVIGRQAVKRARLAWNLRA